MKTTVVKRSIVCERHKTSVSLEDAFWTGLKEIAAARNATLSNVVTAIDGARTQGNLSSAIRLFVLEHYQTQARGPDSRDFNRASAAKLIRRHDKSDIVELSDGSKWRIWPGDVAKTLAWFPTTEIEISKIEDEFCSHVLIGRSDRSRVRAIPENADWPVEQVQRSFRTG